MKTKILLSLICLLGLSYSNAQNVNIPDAVFKNLLVKDPSINTNGDTEISVTEAATVKTWSNFRQSYRGGGVDPNIADLTGIEAFVNIQQLGTNNHSVSKIDLSKNINLESLSLAYYGTEPLNLSSNTKLKSLHLSTPQTSLDLSKLTLLKTLYCHNSKIQTIDLTNNILLTNLTLDNNQLSSLDLSQNTSLTEVSVNKNKLNQLQIDNLNQLTSLSCDYNEISTLNLNNCNSLQKLSCSHNKLESLDLTQKLNLATLLCTNNSLLSLDISNSGKLYQIACDSNAISTLLIGNSQGMTYLSCSHNQINTLDLSKFTALSDLACAHNKLTSLILPINNSLRSLDCSYNNLKTADFSQCQNLDIRLNCNNNQLVEIILPATSSTRIDCSFNNLSSLDLTNMTSLYGLNCSHNQLNNLNASNLTELWELNCSSNPNLSLVCIGSFSRQFSGKYVKDPTAVWSLCQPEAPFLTCYDHIKSTALCEDFKDADPNSNDIINEYVIETTKTRWENNGPVTGEHAYMGMFWTEASDKNGFTAHKKRSGNGILEYTISQKDTTYEPFMLVFGSYADGNVERKLTLDLSKDKTLSFDLKNTGDSAINVSIQLEDIKGNSLVFDSSYVYSNDDPYLYEIGGSGLGWYTYEYAYPNGKSTFTYDYSRAVCGITELAYDDFLGRIRPLNVPHPEIKFDYSQVALVKFMISGNSLQNQTIEISNFKLGDAGLIDAVVDQNISDQNTIYNAYDLLGNFIDSGKESELKLQHNHIYILKSNMEVKKKMILE